MNNMTYATAHHPSPHRDRVDTLWLLLSVFAGPVAWGVQLTVNYALASHPCFPNWVSRSSVLPGWHFVWSVILIVNVIAAVLALAGGAFSSQHWNTVRHEHAGHASQALEAGEGRTRFLALFGMMTGFGFFAAIIFTTISLVMVPQCAG